MVNSDSIARSYKSDIYKVQTLSECPNEKHIAIGGNGPLVAKIPVVIAEPKIQVNVEATVQLDQPALEIKRIRKNVYLTQCKLINIDEQKDGKLFISGFVRKNIEYATVDNECSENGTISGDIRYITARIPFQCVTKIDYVSPLIQCNKGYTAEVEIFTDDIGPCDPCAQKIIGRNPCENKFEHYEYFNEKVYCELEDVQIFEEDIHLNPDSMGCAFPNEQIFQSFEEKMVLLLRVKVFQNQSVNIPKSYNIFDNKNHSGSVDKSDRFKADNSIENNGWKAVPKTYTYTNVVRRR